MFLASILYRKTGACKAIDITNLSEQKRFYMFKKCNFSTLENKKYKKWFDIDMHAHLPSAQVNIAYTVD